MEDWVWAIIVPIALALIGALWALLGKNTEKGESQNAKDIARVETRLDEHIAEDVRIHERVVKIETQQEISNREISELRERTRNMRHDILNEVTKTIMTWYNDIIERLMKK